MTYTSLPTLATPTALDYTLWNEIKTNFDLLYGGVGTSLPASPSDGQPYTLVDSTSAPTYAWQLRYVSAASRWVFVGGIPANAVVETDESANLNGGWFNLATVGPDVVVPRAGDYLATWSVNVGLTTSGSSNGFYVGVAIGNGTPAQTYKVTQTTTTMPLSLSGEYKFTGLSAGDTIRIRYQTNNATGSFAHRWLNVIPVKVS
jgi:hypothetical protein